MEKLAYVFTNGLYANLVVLFKNEVVDVDTEMLNERVLNEVLIPGGYDNIYSTTEELERNDWAKDEDGYFYGMVSVYANDNKEYFLFEENLIVKYATVDEIKSWNDLYWCSIVELD